MKIAFVNNSLDPSGGVGRVMFRVANEMSKLHDVSIISIGDKHQSTFFEAGNLNIITKTAVWNTCYFRRFLHKLNQNTNLFTVINSSKLYDWIYLPSKVRCQWAKIINDGGYDIVIGVQGPNSLILSSIADDLSCKTIGWQHNSFAAYFKTPGAYMWHQENLLKRYIPNLDAYIVLNEIDKNSCEDFWGWNVRSIYNPKSFSSDVKTKCTAKRFIAVGNLTRAKGFDLLIEAFAIFAKNDSEWVLDVYGEGDDREMLQKMIDKYCLNDRIKLRGITNRIQDELIESSVFLLSSRWEGMPMVILEALEIGLPIIAYDITAMKPLVANGVEGIIVPQFDIPAFASAMLQIIKNRADLLNTSQKCLEKSSHFSIDGIIEQWYSLFNELKVKK